MPPNRYQPGELRDADWKDNKETLRRLYLTERRTLKDVKKKMESEHGFPTTPLSTYESKLRDLLGLRKKMKSQDWRPVYRHYLNSGNRHTALHFNDTRIPWGKAWKEIKRSGARTSSEDDTVGLPAGVIMRTPSPVLALRESSSLRRQPPPWHFADAAPEGLRPDALIRRWNIYNIPTNVLRIKMLSKPREPLDEPLDVILNQTPLHIIEKLLKGDSPTLRLATHNLIRYSVGLLRKDDFCNIVRAVSISHPEWVLHDKYLRLAAVIGCSDTCCLLLRMPYYYNMGYNGQYLEAIMESIARGHDECATTLWQHLIQPDTLMSLKTAGFQTAFESFLYHILLQREHGLEGGSKWSVDRGEPSVLQILTWFLEAGANINAPAQLSGFQRNRHYTRHTSKGWMPTIIDDLYYKNLQLHSRLAGHSILSCTEITRSGIRHAAKGGIDALRMYLLSISSYTPVQQDKLLGIFLTEELLGSVGAPHTDLDAIQTLLDYTPSLPYFGMKLNVSAMLYYIVRKARQNGIHHKTNRIVEILTSKGAHVVAETIEVAVESKGTALLQILSPYTADLSTRGTLALCTAMQLDNFEAVSWLLDRGVDGNATVRDNKTKEDITVVARANKSVAGHEPFCIFDYEVEDEVVQSLRPMSYAMLEYAMFRNIKLRASPNDPSIRRLLWLILKNVSEKSAWPDEFKKVQLVLTAGTIDIEHESSSPEPCLLEACFIGKDIQLSRSLALMGLLLEHGIPTKNSGVLTHLIAHRAPNDKIRRVFDSEIDVSVYCGQGLYGEKTPLQAAAGIGSLHWVRLLIERGANVNHPAKGWWGRTALQAACENGNIDLIRLLLIHGAHVNAPPAPDYGVTAFQAAAMHGDFEIALPLLDYGADINAPPSADLGYCALDGAAAYGRLDMVQFLLDLGALSYVRGESGYRGAILKAEKYEPAIADMIRQHALKQGKCGEELTLHYTQWEDGISSDSDDTDDASGVSDTDSDLDFEI
ncbi:hypothetical protein NPX13_g3247 [Xylaria arbuscula]|uniref:Clr5 domain-containing protein n=1 Tax=Xylaria arbuscula TaxID=114810 RepID=A0A9W8NI42_9PEZI|nr:hypothetical protein NPX13_g3247 [Xylaria arbuscula]